MRIVFFNSKAYTREFFERANEAHGHALSFFEWPLRPDLVYLVDGAPAVCPFVNDDLGGETLRRLAAAGTKLIALRCAGYNHVDLKTAAELGLRVTRVPAYSPHAVAEHTLALILTLERKIHRAYARVRDGNFALEGLLGEELYGRTAGVVGTGLIGIEVCRILRGFGCRVLAHDPKPHPQAAALGVAYVALPELYRQADLLTLHCPLTPETRHRIDAAAIAQMKRGVMLINTSRGALIDTPALIQALKSGQVGSVGLDVYEEEGDLFFQDLSSEILQDDLFARLLTFPNVVITGHQAFFTRTALSQIAATTLQSVTALERGQPLPNEIRYDPRRR